jgi:MEDS: MEthanogen/methylotroph, DcmR Sensory domain
MSPWKKLLDRPEPHGHLVQLYQADERALVANVGQYLGEGHKRGEGLLVIATPPNVEAFRAELEKRGADVDAVVRDGHLAFFDAEATLSSFLVDGQPDWVLFEAVVGAAMRQVRAQNQFAGLRAYGEMVGILWNARRFAAAIRLEQYWNKLLARSSFSLFCGYAIDVFGKDFQIGSLDALLCAHTHLLPATDGNLELAVNRAMDEILGSSSHDLKLLIKANFRPSWAVMPFGESMVLWLRNNLPKQADHIMSVAKQHYQILRSETAPAFE